MSVEEELVQILENPQDVEDPEQKELLEDIERHYTAYLEAEKQEIREYEEEMIEDRLETYYKVQGMEKIGGQYEF